MSSLLYMYVLVATSCCYLPTATADVFVRATQGSYETMECIHTTASDSTRVCIFVYFDRACSAAACCAARAAFCAAFAASFAAFASSAEIFVVVFAFEELFQDQTDPTI